MIKNKKYSHNGYSIELLRVVKDFNTPPAGKIQQLLESQADPNAQDNNGNSVLKKAIQNNIISVDDIKALLEAKADPNAQDNNQQTSFHIALEPHVDLNRKTQLVKTLIQHNANPDATHCLRETPKILIQIREKANKDDPVAKMFNDTTLIEEIKQLIKTGWDINQSFKDDIFKDYYNLLERAVINNKPDVVKFLLKNGADKSVVTISRPIFENFSLLSLITDSPDYKEVSQLLARDDDGEVELIGEGGI